MIGKRQELARFSSDFYRNYYYKLLRALMFSMVIILLLIIGIIYQVIVAKTPNYYASTTEGKIIQMVPLK